jgi:hypothetical protein
MYEQVEKPKENKSRSVSNSVAQQKSNGKQGFGFVDNRAQAVTQRKILQRVYGTQTAGPIPDRLEYGDSSMATTCAMVLFTGAGGVNVAERTFGSGGGLHAEEKVIAWLQEQVNAGTLTPQGAGTKDYTLFLNVSKSPCSSTSAPATRTDGGIGCHERLTAINTAGLTQAGPPGNIVTFDVQVAATKPYQPPIAGAKAASTASNAGFGGAGGGSFDFVRN